MFLVINFLKVSNHDAMVCAKLNITFQKLKLSYRDFYVSLFQELFLAFLSDTFTKLFSVKFNLIFLSDIYYVEELTVILKLQFI